MNHNELTALADKYQHKAEKAYQNYQETGITRYDRERRQNEDLAESLRMAANAADEHSALIHLRAAVASLAYEAKRVEFMPEEQRDKARETLRKNLIASANLAGINTI